MDSAGPDRRSRRRRSAKPYERPVPQRQVCADIEKMAFQSHTLTIVATDVPLEYNYRTVQENLYTGLSFIGKR
jgi:hypothetical protein